MAKENSLTLSEAKKRGPEALEQFIREHEKDVAGDMDTRFRERMLLYKRLQGGSVIRTRSRSS